MSSEQNTKEIELESLQEKLQASIKIKDKSLELLIRLDIARKLSDIGKITDSTEYYISVITDALVLGNYAVLKEACFNLANSYASTKDFQNAVINLGEYLNLSKESHDHVNECIALRCMCETLPEIGNYHLALHYAIRYYEISEEQNNEHGLKLAKQYMERFKSFINICNCSNDHLISLFSLMDVGSKPIIHLITNQESENSFSSNDDVNCKWQKNMKYGLQFYDLKQYDRALKFFERNLQFNDSKFIPLKAELLQNLASTLRELERYDEAIIHLRNLLKISQELKDKFLEKVVLIQLKNIHQRKGNTTNNDVQFNRAQLDPSFLVNDQRVSDEKLAEMYYRMGEIGYAISLNLKIRGIAESKSDFKLELETRIKLAHCYFKLNNNNEAIKYYNQSLSMAIGAEHRAKRGPILYNLFQIYRDMSNNEEAIEYLNLYLFVCQKNYDKNGQCLAYDSLQKINKSFDCSLSYATMHYHLAHTIDDRDEIKIAIKSITELNEHHRINWSPEILSQSTIPVNSQNNSVDYEIWKIYDQIANNYCYLKMHDKSIELHTKNLHYAQFSLKNKLAEAQSLNSIGYVHITIGDYNLAIVYFHSALSIAIELNDRVLEELASYKLGQTYYLRATNSRHLNDTETLRDLITASHYLHKTLSIEGYQRQPECAISLLGYIYFLLHEYQTALEYFEKKLLIATQNDNIGLQQESHRDIARIYVALENFEFTFIHLKQALECSEITNDRQIKVNYEDLFITLDKLNRFDLLLEYKKKYFDYLHKSNDCISIANVCKSIMDICKRQKKYNEALTYATWYYIFACQNDNSLEKGYASKFISNMNELQKQASNNLI